MIKKKSKLTFRVLVKYLPVVVSPNAGEYQTDNVFYDFLNVAMSLVTCMSLKSILELFHQKDKTNLHPSRFDSLFSSMCSQKPSHHSLHK